MTYRAFDDHAASVWPGISASNPTDRAIWQAVQSRLADPADLARMLSLEGLSPAQVAVAMRACGAPGWDRVYDYIDRHAEMRAWADMPRVSAADIATAVEAFRLREHRRLAYDLAAHTGCVTEAQIDRAMGDEPGTMARWVMDQGLAPLRGLPPVIAQQAPADYRTASVALTATLTEAA